LEGFNEGDESDDYCPLGRAELDGFSAKKDKEKDK
jgi:hypothetical protein